MASSNTDFCSKAEAVLLQRHISAALTKGLQHHANSLPYRHSAWTTFDQREHSESHASVIRDDKAAASKFKAARAKTNRRHLNPHTGLCHQPTKPGDGESFLMTDEDKNVKNRILRWAPTLQQLFFTNLCELQGFLCIFSPHCFSNKVYGGAEKSSSLWEGLAPVNHLLQ